MSSTVEQWGVYELALDGPQDGNPFVDVAFGARFRYQHREVQVDGFYDGDGIYRVRFMPDVPGAWSCETMSSAEALDGHSGTFTCVPAAAGNHGPVSVQHAWHFAYADGTPYWQVGTTCYVWTHQGNALEEQTLTTLKTAPFNKMRMCVFPKHYAYNTNEPPLYPFVKDATGGWDWTRFDPAFFRHFEQRVMQLQALGIEADIILFHPYDRWGFARMPAAADDRYLRYSVARLAAYRNVWWSMANEWDLMDAKIESDWDRFLRITAESDPYQHPRSIHNCNVLFDHGKPWVTHVSYQANNFNMNLEQVRDFRAAWRKPVIVDECCYEGDIFERWGSIPPQEMVRRFWEGTIHGAYVGHGETYVHPDDILWWSKGGVLHGESPARIAFYRRILEESPAGGLDPVPNIAGYFKCAGQPGAYYLTYFGVHQPRQITLTLPEDAAFAVDIIDTWDMTITPLPEPCSGSTHVELPRKPYIALRARRV